MFYFFFKRLHWLRGLHEPWCACERGQLLGASSLLPPHGPGDRTWITRLGGTCLYYPLRHLVGPQISNFLIDTTQTNEFPIPDLCLPPLVATFFCWVERHLLSSSCFLSITQESLPELSPSYMVCGKCAISSLSGHLFPGL